MKPQYLLFVITAHLFFVVLSPAQTLVKVVRGSLEPLQGEQDINVEFTYNNMRVGAELTESDYVLRKKAEYNEKEKGLGDKWEQKWYENRKNLFEPSFLASIEVYSKLKTGFALAKYTLIFNTNYTEPGWHYGAPGTLRMPSRISGEAIVIESANPDNVVALITVVNVKGNSAMYYEFDAGFKIDEAYANAGKAVGRLLRR